MFSTLRNRFGIPGVISVIALVFAMIGGAYAASNGGSGKIATASAKKAAKGPRGPKGAAGPAGPAGAQGPAGPAGPKGDTGAAGSNGAPGEKGEKGATGTNGLSVEAKPEAPGGPNCTNGGVVFKIGATPAGSACNGANGAPGAPGSQGPKGDKGDPWTVGGTLPPGATLKGGWALANAESDSTDISFGIPLAAPLAESAVHGIPSGGSVPAVCDDGVGNPPSVGNPEADSGHLCVFVGDPYEGITPEPIQPPMIVPLDGKLNVGSGLFGSSRAGALLVAGGPGPFPGSGSWAVTG